MARVGPLTARDICTQLPTGHEQMQFSLHQQRAFAAVSFAAVCQMHNRTCDVLLVV
jgi:hypothetical protein